MWRVWIEMDLYESYDTLQVMSPSVWRVWIEIGILKITLPSGNRHPPCGGCGLKFERTKRHGKHHAVSPSVWRVWIEIGRGYAAPQVRYGHPPCGGCGLKSSVRRWAG